MDGPEPSGVNDSKVFASSNKKLGALLEKQNFHFCILYFQITALPFDRPSSFLKNPASSFLRKQSFTFTMVLAQSYKLVYYFHHKMKISLYYFHPKKKLAP